MKVINCLIIISTSLLVISCSKVLDPVQDIGIGSKVISYQAEDSTSSLIIPPDLTKPSSEGLFTENFEVSNNQDIVTEVGNVEVMRDNYRRWLVVDKPTNEVWSLSKEFFRSYGFVIEKENQKIGILETDYLEIETKVPEKSLGMIRTALSKVLKTQYGLPIADKYRVRIEPTDNQNKSEVYLTLSSIGEVVSGSMRLWEPREKDVELETEMLLTLMVFLGSDRAEAINKIQASTDSNDILVKVVKSDTGYATLVFPYNKKQSWSYLGWALDELDVDIEDRDIFEGSYFISISPSKGFFATLLNTVKNTKTYQLYVKQIDESYSEVIFVDLSNENDEDTLSFSFEFFNKLAAKF
jgi:outer membrane protein assembly factor BamC